MTRCECAGVTFEEIAQIAQRAGPSGSLEEIGCETGCGQLCTACVPDLLSYLAGAIRTNPQALCQDPRGERLRRLGEAM